MGGAKVLMAPVNIAGQPIVLTNELRRQGVDVTLLQYGAGAGHAFGYPSDRTVNLQGRHRMEAQVETLESVLDEGYDIFHFWMSTFFGGRRYGNMYGLDLPFIKARGRRIVYRGTGFDLRVKSMHVQRNPHHPFQYGYELDVDEDAQRLYLDFLRSYVDLFIVQDPEMREFMPEARVVPRAIDVEAIAPAGHEPTDRPLVVHAPSKTLVKGTPLLEQALTELAEEGIAFDFKLITGMPHDEAMSWYRRADVIVDQLLIGWYGVLALEGLALGKPVVTYVRDDLYESFTPRIPIANADPSTLKDVLRKVLTEDALRAELAAAGPEFVREVHDVRKVAGAVREIYDEVMETPVKEPAGGADLQHFLTQFRDLEAVEQRRAERFKAAKYEEVLQELPRLRYQAQRADDLVEETAGLKQRVRELEQQAKGRPVEPAVPAPQPAGGSSSELARLRRKAKRGDELFEEVKALRYRAKRLDELQEEVLALRRRVRQLENRRLLHTPGRALRYARRLLSRAGA